MTAPDRRADRTTTPSAEAPARPGTRSPTRPARPTRPDTEEDLRVIAGLDAFLDELAAGHRDKMDEVVGWLTKGGRLDYEIEKSVGALSVLFHKWSIEIGFLLRMHGTLRFNELKQHLAGIGSRTLSQRLKALEEQNIVQRTMYAEVPIRVEYSLTPRGLKMADLFLPVIAHLRISSARKPADG